MKRRKRALTKKDFWNRKNCAFGTPLAQDGTFIIASLNAFKHLPLNYSTRIPFIHIYIYIYPSFHIIAT